METNNNPNWLITKDLAKKLEEIGYKEECLFVFMPKDEKIGFTTERQRHYNFINGIDKNICDDNSIFYPAVTWTEVLEWFRKRGFYCYIKKKSFPERYIYYIDYGLTTYSKENLRDELLPKTYEEAREEMVYKLIELYSKTNNTENEK